MQKKDGKTRPLLTFDTGAVQKSCPGRRDVLTPGEAPLALPHIPGPSAWQARPAAGREYGRMAKGAPWGAPESMRRWSCARRRTEWRLSGLMFCLMFGPGLAGSDAGSDALRCDHGLWAGFQPGSAMDILQSTLLVPFDSTLAEPRVVDLLPEPASGVQRIKP